ncbi:hypothetical protein M406DRAFT_329546 [Cryphonectria parasitica EP155]|uniref:Uncharacterized protein n=1 Tax=Cryphonectria parasitica (strain ATCC 38755 / EP155) TaxID=660469 RepID=A0A9P4Y3F6_CRYP1|nr:uncharacterized protein M406DRAFT_329546 [Cryphonectria parasitica EP155]KAF3765657.1 hypothetical protein M406DRAFT_329546 [Cryphonectria parasitica EP155]
MPTATSIASWGLRNLGPLTTTFTPAPSCTSHSEIWIVSDYTYSDSAMWDYVGHICGTAFASAAGCVPSGSAVDSDYAAYTAAPSASSAEYYSPGLVCPSGWSTIGLATKVDNGSVETTGPAFVSSFPTSGPLVDLDYLENPLGNAMVEAMDAGETAVLCCPSGFDANKAGLYGFCTSTVPDYPIPTSVCIEFLNSSDTNTVNTTLTLLDHTFTGSAEPITGISDLLSTVTETFTAPTGTETGVGVYNTADMSAVNVAGVVYLIHGASDTASATGTANVAATGAVGLPGVVALFTLVTAFTSGFLLMI